MTSQHHSTTHRPAGWYILTAQIADVSDPGLFQLDLGMPDAPGHLSRIHLPAPGPNGEIKTIIWLRSHSEYLDVLNPLGERAALSAPLTAQRRHSVQALAMMLRQLHRSASDPNERLTPMLAKNTARWRKKGFNGMVLGTYKDYYRMCLGGTPAPTDDYANWVQRFDSLDDLKYKTLKDRARRLPENAPLLSILMPVFDPDPAHLKRAIESVLAQLNERWELCIVDDYSRNPQIAEILRRYSDSDKRIRYHRAAANSGIVSATNTALEMSKGSFVAFLDHDDELRPHSLLRIAETIVENPSARLIYSDEDKLDTSGKRCQPHFKPGWNPELLRAVNYICHLCVVERNLIINLGGLRKGFDGAQDYDLVLRITEQLDDSSIIHVPEILYHWRITEQSTAQSPGNKFYATENGRLALIDALDRRDIKATVDHATHPTTYHVSYQLTDTPPLVSIIIPTRNATELVAQCIDSIKEKTTYTNYEIIVVDNGSTEPEALSYLSSLEERGLAKVLRYDIPFNYSALNNHGVKQAHGDIIALVNNDIEVITPNWLSEMVSLALLKRTGAVGAKLLYSDRTIQHAGVILGIGGVAGHSHKYFPEYSDGYMGRLKHRQNLSAVTAACLVVRKAHYLEVGGLDEQNLSVAFNDVDFCMRLTEANYRNIWTPHAVLYHHESVSRGAEDTREKQERFLREVGYMQQRWGRRLTSDAAYNPNLTLAHEDFSLSFPPRTKIPGEPFTTIPRETSNIPMKSAIG